MMDCFILGCELTLIVLIWLSVTGHYYIDSGITGKRRAAKKEKLMVTKCIIFMGTMSDYMYTLLIILFAHFPSSFYSSKQNGHHQPCFLLCT